MQITVILITISQPILSKLILQKLHNTHEEKLKKYLTPRYQTRFYNKDEWLNLSINDCTHQETAKNLINWFLKHSPNPRFINNEINYQNTTTLLLFLDELNEIPKIIETIRFRNMIQFIIVGQVKNETDLPKILRNMWKNTLLNYIVVYATRFKLKTVSFDPFQNNLIWGNKTPMLYDKLNNLHNFQLRVAMFNNPPLSPKIQDGEWSGNDQNTMKLVMRVMKASYRIHETTREQDYDGIYQSLITNRSDFSFICFFASNKYSQVEFSYPHIQDTIAALIPFLPNNTPSKYLQQTFDVYVLACFVSLIFIITAMIKLGQEKQHFSSIASFIVSFKFFLGQSASQLESLKVQLKILLIVWLYVCLIFGVAFQSNFGMMLTRFQPPLQIETIKDLKESGLKIKIRQRYFDETPKKFGLQDQMIIAQKPELIDLVMGRNTSYVIVNPLSVLLKLLASTKADQEPYYQVMDEYLIPGYRTYMFQRHSPYVNKIERTVMLLHGFGLLQFHFNQKQPLDRYWSEGKVPLSYEHFSSLFAVLFYGHLISSVIFILEYFNVKLLGPG